MNRILLFITLFSVSLFLIADAKVDNEVDFTLSVDVIKTDPVCKLSAASKTIDFGNIDAAEIVSVPPVGTTTFNFTDCAYVKNIDISFSGVNIDTQNNYINNTAGPDKATGIAIKLLNSNDKEIKLIEEQTLKPDSNNNANLVLKAKVATTEPNARRGVRPGAIDTSVTLEITYN